MKNAEKFGEKVYLDYIYDFVKSKLQAANELIIPRTHLKSIDEDKMAGRIAFR